jgi:ribonuclease HII
LVAAAAVLDPSMDYPGVTDSKKLGPEALREAYRLITRTALSWAVAVKSPAQVDSLNPLKASLLAMAEAWASLSLVPALTLADGTIVPPLPRGAKSLALAKGDSLSLCVGAASILAKATRDDIMAEMAAAYPGYGFERHKGYGTREHLEALSRLGPCPIHRLSYKRVASPRSRGLGF